MKNKVVIICGPTASGKTSLSIKAALEFNGEIISADSMQIYKGMDIGTAKPTADERCGVRHHLIDIKSPDELFSVAEFKTLAEEAADGIINAGKLPILVGGTGLYVDNFVYSTDFEETKSDPKLRYELEERAKAEGGAVLLNELAQFDKDSAARLHEKDIKRIIRAIEVYRTTGKTISELNKLSRICQPKYDVLYLLLEFSSRELLYERINRRVDSMIEVGLLDEVKKIFSQKLSSTAAQAIGYKEFAEYLDGTSSFEQAVDTLKRRTRNYAKRQITWFKRKTDAKIISADEPERAQSEAFCYIRGFLNEK